MKEYNLCNNAERVERFQQAIRVMSDMTAERIENEFNMSTWGEKTACGTVACAAGWCAMDPWFNERGLMMAEIERTDSYSGETWVDFTFSKEGNASQFFGEAAVDAVFTRASFMVGAKNSVDTHSKVLQALKDHLDFVIGGEVDESYMYEFHIRSTVEADRMEESDEA